MRILVFKDGNMFRAIEPSDPAAVASGKTKDEALTALASALGEPTSKFSDDIIEDFTV